MRAQQVESVAVSVAYVHYHGLVQLAGQQQLAQEHLPLHLVRRVVVIVVQAYLAQRDGLGRGHPDTQALLAVRAETQRVLRMHAGGGVQPGVLGRQAQHGLLGLRAVAYAYGQLHSGLAHAGKDLVAVGVKLFVGDVAMSVKKHILLHSGHAAGLSAGAAERKNTLPAPG